MPLQRYKLTVAYRGTRYHGWQQQPALPTYKGERPSEFVPESEREEILATVKADNPGISRWRKMLEPLCLTALEARLGAARQKRLFPDADD